MTPDRVGRWIRTIALLGLAWIAIAIGVGLFLSEPRTAWSRPPAPPVDEPFPTPDELRNADLIRQTEAERQAKSSGCVGCHQNVRDPHTTETLRLGCVDCHGGDASTTDKFSAHIQPHFPNAWPGSAKPVRSYTLLNHESPEYIRFVNPGDLRVAHLSCGLAGCHTHEVETNRKQIMATGAMLWGSALYNNGTVPFKRSRF